MSHSLGEWATEDHNRPLVANFPGGGPPHGVPSLQVYLEAQLGPIVHQGKPHKVPAGGIVCLLRCRSTQPDGCSVS